MAKPPASPNPAKARPTAALSGTCDPAFEAVKAAFQDNFSERGEIGGAVCVRVGGRAVVDLWGGYCDGGRTRPWQRDTLVNAYSVGKGITAMLVLSLVERGELRLDDPVEGIWPEFAAEDKGGTTLRMLLSHQGGLPGVRRTLPSDAMLDWSAMTNALAEQRPYWTPGEAHGYHVNTYGFVVGEPVCRRLGMSFAEALRARVTGPRNADFHIGLPKSEHARVAPIFEAARAGSGTESAAGNEGGGSAERDAGNSSEPEPKAAEMAKKHFGAGDDATAEMLGHVYFNPAGLSGFGYVNRADWRSASIPSTNSHATARAVAELYEAFMTLDPAEGGFVGPGLRAEATATAVDGLDRVLNKPSRFGLGFQLSQPTRAIGGSETSYGHFGYGGTLGFADPENGLSFGYLMNRPGERWQTPRTNALVEAVYASLG